MSYKISVIIPVFNAQNDLNNAVDSIISQTFGFDNIELILVDDASTDSSRDIIRNYQKEYGNIKLVELSQNSGLPGKPRSLGIDYTTANYIIFLEILISLSKFMIISYTLFRESQDAS